MHKTQWLSQTEFALRRAGMPQDYVNRTCSELSDHLAECEHDNRPAKLLEESPRDLAKAIVTSYRSRGLLRRVPPVLLLLLPLPLTVLMSIAYFVGWGIVLEATMGDLQQVEHLSLKTTMLIYAIFHSGKLAGPALSGWATLTICRRMARPWYWAASLFVLQSLAILATRPDMEFALRQVSLNVGIGAEHMPHLSQVLLAAVVAMTGFVVVAKQRRQQRELLVSGS